MDFILSYSLNLISLVFGLNHAISKSVKTIESLPCTTLSVLTSHTPNSCGDVSVYDDRRRQQRHPSAELSEGDAGFEERGVETLDEMALIRNIVEHLPPLQRQLFRMKEIEGYDAGEIMQITGCTADNLRKNLSRARLKIRDTYMKLMKGAREEK